MEDRAEALECGAAGGALLQRGRQHGGMAEVEHAGQLQLQGGPGAAHCRVSPFTPLLTPAATGSAE